MSGFGKARVRQRSAVPVFQSGDASATAMVWCDACRYMHAPGAHACRHDFRDGDVCSKCDATRKDAR
jgi:hypothetical protein